MTDLSLLFDQYESNVLKWPAILKVISDQLGVTCMALQAIGIGFNPHNQTWIVPERDPHGTIIGLMQRYKDGNKTMVRGSHRGLIYAVNYDYRKDAEKYVSGKHNWIRVGKDSGLSCPICGKADGCLLPVSNPTNPAAVVCVHISEGANKSLELGYLHILQPEHNLSDSFSPILTPSELPVIVVEGHSDTCAAMDLGFTAIGRPSAEGGTALLHKMLSGKSVIVVGENDAGAGVKGMEGTFQTLRHICKSVFKLLPPQQFKDLRAWKMGSNLDQDTFLDYTNKSGTNIADPDIFDSDSAAEIAERFIKQRKTKDGDITLRNYKGEWMEWRNGCYETIDVEEFRGQLYSFLDGKKYTKVDLKGNVSVEPYKPTRAKVSDIVDALNQWCPIAQDPPAWITTKKHPALLDTIAFQNGILDVREYMEGHIKLHKPTPDFFSFYVFPYNFDERLESPIWEDFLRDIFNQDQEKISLLAQWFGYNCVPDMSFEKLMLFTGVPRSGKSTVLDTLQQMLGERQCSSTSFQSLTGAFGYQPLMGKLAALIGDAKTPKYHDTEAVLEKILHITGGDSVSINRKRVSELPSIHLTARFTIAMNDLPAFTDHARALEARLMILMFENSYLGREDRTLKLRLKQEAQQGRLINFALRGLKELRTQKNFGLPKSSIGVMEQFSELASPVLAFVKECCDIRPFDEPPSPKWTVTKDQMYEVWKCWCNNQGRYFGIKEQFGRWLRSACPGVTQGRSRIDKDREYLYNGLRLNEYALHKYMGG